MKTTSPDDVASLFDLPPLPAAPQPDAPTLEAQEAALAAELAAELESGDFADDAPDSRTDHRVDVSWTARMQLPGGRAIALQLRNVSEAGVGLMSDEPIPANTVVDFEMHVPPLHAGGATTVVQGAIRTTYTVAQAAKTLCGATWQAPPAGLALVRQWIARLRR